MSDGSEFSLGRAAADPRASQLAVIFESSALSWSELAARCLRMGAQIANALGEARGPVALRATNRLATAVALYAMFERGITVVPLHPRLTDAEAAAIAQDARCALVLDDAALDALEASGHPESTRAMDARTIDAESPLAILYTSGTTGAPKGAVLSRRAFIASAAASEDNLGWREDDRWLLCLPLCHVGGLSVLTRCLFARRTVVLQRRFDERSALDAIVRERVTIASFVPTMLDRLLDCDRDNALTRVRAVLLGGAAASNTLIDRCAQRAIAVRTTYGLTEACSQVTTQRERDPRVIERGSGPPVTGTELRARRDDGSECEQGEVGRLSVRGPTLFSGYFQGESRSKDQWFDTGDYGFFDERGCVHIVARRMDLIVTGGENVYPLEVERALEGIAGVEAVMVFGVDDARWGQLVCCAIVANARFDEGVFARECERRLAAHKRPRRVALCAELPVTAANKPDRRAAAALFAERLAPVRSRS